MIARASMRALVLSGLLLTTLLARPAAAAGPPLLLGVTGCGELDEREIRRLVAAELGTLAVEQQGPDVTLVTVRCGGLSVVIRVDDPLSRKTVERAFDTGPLDQRARARWVALAASELVLASWAELETNPIPQVEPLGPPAPAPIRRAAEAAVRRRAPPLATRGSLTPNPQMRGSVGPAKKPSESYPLRAVALGSARTFLDESGSLWGGGLRISEERFNLMSWSVDFLFEAGRVHWRGRAYDVRSGTFGGWLMLYTTGGPVTARLGIGIRGGLVGSLGDEGSGSTENAIVPWGWPLVASSVSVVSGPVAFEFSLEGGYVILPIGSTNGISVSVGGVSAQIGIGLAR